MQVRQCLSELAVDDTQALCLLSLSRSMGTDQVLKTYPHPVSFLGNRTLSLLRQNLRVLKQPSIRTRRKRVEQAIGPISTSAGGRTRTKAIKHQLILAIVWTSCLYIDSCLHHIISWIPLQSQARLLCWLWLVISISLISETAFRKASKLISQYESILDWFVFHYETCVEILCHLIGLIFKTFATSLGSILVRLRGSASLDHSPASVQSELQNVPNRPRQSFHPVFPGNLPNTPARVAPSQPRPTSPVVSALQVGVHQKLLSLPSPPRHPPPLSDGAEAQILYARHASPVDSSQQKAQGISENKNDSPSGLVEGHSVTRPKRTKRNMAVEQRGEKDVSSETMTRRRPVHTKASTLQLKPGKDSTPTQSMQFPKQTTTNRGKRKASAELNEEPGTLHLQESPKKKRKITSKSSRLPVPISAIQPDIRNSQPRTRTSSRLQSATTVAHKQ